MWVDMGVYVCVCVCIYPARGANEPISECVLSASKPDVIGICACHSNGNMILRL